jgi:group I intron endonuclease
MEGDGMYGFIYLTINKVNGKKYIGMCKNTHGKLYLGSGKLLKQAIKKYGKENFERVVLQECQTFEELSEAEKIWIDNFNAVEDSNFYNLTTGGFGGNSDYMKEYWDTFTDEERKLSRNWNRRDMTGENNPMFNKKHSEETKKKIGSKSVNRNWNRPNHFGEKNPKSKKVEVEKDGKKLYYNCLKDFFIEHQIVPYSTLKTLARNQRFSQKHKLKIKYV